MEILLLLVAGAINIFCFMIGAKVGQTVQKGEKIEMPSVNPLKASEERQNKKQAEREQEKLNVILRNIEGYDGTARGQEDVPR
jgi:hypothetical protein